MHEPLNLAVNLSAALAGLASPALADEAAKAAVFPIAQRTTTQRSKDIAKERDRRRARKCIRAENAAPLVAQFPTEDGDSVHAYLPGEFVFGDIIGQTVRRFGPPGQIDIATLSLSEKNVVALEDLLRDHPALRIRLALSVYFESTNKKIFLCLTSRLGKHPRFRLSTGRIHSKIVLFDYEDHPLVLNGSSNLRSSNCIESLVVDCSPELHVFHTQFFDDFEAACVSGKFDNFDSHFTTPAT